MTSTADATEARRMFVVAKECRLGLRTIDCVGRLKVSRPSNLVSWVESREVFNEEATKIRAEFNANVGLAADSAKTARLLREAKERLALQTDPYIHAAMPGGSLFMRNPAIPLEALYPDGIPAGVSRRRMNVDMSNIPTTTLGRTVPVGNNSLAKTRYTGRRFFLCSLLQCDITRKKASVW